MKVVAADLDRGLLGQEFDAVEGFVA